MPYTLSDGNTTLLIEDEQCACGCSSSLESQENKSSSSSDDKNVKRRKYYAQHKDNINKGRRKRDQKVKQMMIDRGIEPLSRGRPRNEEPKIAIKRILNDHELFQERYIGELSYRLMGVGIKPRRVEELVSEYCTAFESVTEFICKIGRRHIEKTTSFDDNASENV